MQIEMRPLDQIKPYDRNPRRNDGAVDAVAKSTLDERMWKPVPGYEGLYEVSDDGCVRRASKSRMAPAGYPLKPRRTWDGYVKYALSKRGKFWHVKAHRLVALAFLGPPPEPGAHVAHWDGDKTNNHVANLRWATPVENEADKRRHGHYEGLLRGDRHPGARLTSDIVRELRKLVAGGVRFKAAATRFGIPPITAYQAIFGETWRCVTDPPPLTHPRKEKNAA